MTKTILLYMYMYMWMTPEHHAVMKPQKYTAIHVDDMTKPYFYKC